MSRIDMFQEPFDYTFQIPPVFEGPLDLLLRLIEREELDITAVALAQVADQYLAHVRAIESPDPAHLSAFLAVAARLLLIKSRALLPRLAVTNDEVAQEAEDLVRQLQEYQRFRQAAVLLRQWDEQGRRLFTRPPTAIPEPEHPQLDVTLAEMIAAVQRRMQLLMPTEPEPAPMPVPRSVTVAEVAGRIRERLRSQAWISFEDLLSLAVSRVEVLVALWSVLELLKRRAIVVEQDALFGPIMIGRGPLLRDVDLHDLETEE